MRRVRILREVPLELRQRLYPAGDGDFFTQKEVPAEIVIEVQHRLAQSDESARQELIEKETAALVREEVSGDGVTTTRSMITKGDANLINSFAGDPARVAALEEKGIKVVEVQKGKPTFVDKLLGRK